MPWTQGEFNVPNNFVAQYNAGQKKIRADLMDENFNDVASAINKVNTDLPDEIKAEVLQMLPVAATEAPAAPGTAAVGTSTKYAREDHVHALPTIPAASSTKPKANGTAAVGTSTTYARADHVHPQDTSSGVVSTIIYPNGGTAASPANVTNNQRYVMGNPYSGYFVQCEAQIKYGNKWGCTGWVYAGGAHGVAASQLLPDDKIVIQTGDYAVYARAVHTGTPLENSSVTGTSAPCRVIVTRLGKM